MKKLLLIFILLIVNLLPMARGIYAQSSAIIASNQEKEVVVSTNKNQIIILTAQPEVIVLYNTLGKEVYRATSKVGENIVKVTIPGFYLVKVGNVAKKVAIKNEN